MKKRVYKIVIRFKGDLLVTDFYDYTTLKELMKDYNIKRSEIGDWWKVYY